METTDKSPLTNGTKFDTGKLRWDLLPPDAMKELVTVLTKGAEKYADRNWEKGMQWGRIKAALERHINAWELGERNDPEFGTHHLAHAMWCAMVLLTYDLRCIGEDDLRVLLQKM
jgi:hypothetical protein